MDDDVPSILEPKHDASDKLLNILDPRRRSAVWNRKPQDLDPALFGFSDESGDLEPLELVALQPHPPPRLHETELGADEKALELSAKPSWVR